MNDLGIDLTGKKVLVRSPIGQKAKIPAVQRVFMCKSGSGCVMDMHMRTISGYWVIDKYGDTINSWDIEKILEG